MARFALTKTTPLLLGMLALAGCPDDPTPIDEGTSTGGEDTGTTTDQPPPVTTIEPDSGSESGPGPETGDSTTAADPCDGVECPEGEECIAGSCFMCGMPTCETECAEGETCQCPADDICCDVGECSAPVCPLPAVPGNFADCLEDDGSVSDAPCDGATCVTDDDPATAAVCLPTGCEATCQCPAAPEGAETPVTCDDVTNDGSNDCWLSCEGGETCPEGMVCFGGFICLFSNTAPVEVPTYGDCFNVPGAMCADGQCVQAPDAGVCVQSPCTDASDCPAAPATGNAVVTCGNITQPDMDPECYLDCQGGATCPDGMVCYGGFACLWPEVMMPPPMGDGYGDCADNPAATCQPGEDACVTDAATGAAACSESGCAAAGDCPAAPATGDAPVACGDLGAGNTCYLDCAGGQTCPDGTACTVLGGGASACLWPNDGFLLDEDFEQGYLRPGWSLIDGDGNVPAGQVAFVDDAFVVTDEFEPGANFGAYSTSWYMPAGMSNDWIITPQITLGAASALTWDAWAPDPDFPDGYEVRVSTGMPIEADFMANPAIFTIADEADAFAPHTVDLAAAGYMNEAVYIAFRNNSNDEFILVVDNVRITE